MVDLRCRPAKHSVFVCVCPVDVGNFGTNHTSLEQLYESGLTQQHSINIINQSMSLDVIPVIMSIKNYISYPTNFGAFHGFPKLGLPDAT